MSIRRAVTIVQLLVVAITVTVAAGWFMNIFKLLDMSVTPLTTWLIVRVIGIFLPPLGGVLGYIN